MTRPNRRNPVATALCLNAALLGGILVVLLGRDASPTLVAPAMGQAQPPAIAGGAGLFIVPAQFSTSTWGLYLMDVDQQTLAAYQYAPGERQLRLVAARNFRYDRRLGNFNTAMPSPEEVREMLEQKDAGPRGARGAAGAAVAPVAPVAPSAGTSPQPTVAPAPPSSPAPSSPAPSSAGGR